MNIVLYVEETDTFGDRWSGNYCWVNKYLVEIKPHWNTGYIVRKIKEKLNWTGLRTDTCDYGNLDLWISPRSGLARVAFACIAEPHHIEQFSEEVA